MWDPGAEHDPGLCANYRRGRVHAQCNKAHFTVGRDSRALIRNQGLATYLFPKVGRRIQFAPLDAVCSDSCEWCDEGPGFEVERLSWAEPFTADQTREVGEALRFSNLALGIPLDQFWDGSRLSIGDPFRGTVNHGSLVHRACDQHTDGWTRDEFNAAVGAAPSSDDSGDDDVYLYKATDTAQNYLVHPYGKKRIAVGVSPAQYFEYAKCGVKGNGEGKKLQLVAQVKTHLTAQLGRTPTNDEIKAAIR